MNPIDLVLLACAVADPSACHEYHLLVQSASPQACTMEAEPYLAQWIGDHPKLRVARWYCTWPALEGEKI
jgi:hypothetical protein